jgi:hypothetical protein
LMGEPGAGRGTRQVLGGRERGAFHTQLKHGLVPKTVRIIAVRIARGEVRDPLGEEIPARVGHIRRVAFVPHGGSQTCGEAELPVDPPQQEGPEVRR